MSYKNYVYLSVVCIYRSEGPFALKIFFHLCFYISRDRLGSKSVKRPVRCIYIMSAFDYIVVV